MEIEVMEQFINSDCYTWKTSSPSTLLFTAYNKKYLELHNECAAVIINNNIYFLFFCRSLVSFPLFLARLQENLPPSPKLKVSVTEHFILVRISNMREGGGCFYITVIRKSFKRKAEHGLN